MGLVLIVSGSTDHDAGVKVAKAKPSPSNAVRARAPDSVGFVPDSIAIGFRLSTT